MSAPESIPGDNQEYSPDTQKYVRDLLDTLRQNVGAFQECHVDGNEGAAPKLGEDPLRWKIADYVFSRGQLDATLEKLKITSDTAEAAKLEQYARVLREQLELQQMVLELGVAYEAESREFETWLNEMKQTRLLTEGEIDDLKKTDVTFDAADFRGIARQAGFTGDEDIRLLRLLTDENLLAGGDFSEFRDLFSQSEETAADGFSRSFVDFQAVSDTLEGYYRQEMQNCRKSPDQKADWQLLTGAVSLVWKTRWEALVNLRKRTVDVVLEKLKDGEIREQYSVAELSKVTLLLQKQQIDVQEDSLTLQFRMMESAADILRDSPDTMDIDDGGQSIVFEMLNQKRDQFSRGFDRKLFERYTDDASLVDSIGKAWRKFRGKDTDEKQVMKDVLKELEATAGTSLRADAAIVENHLATVGKEMEGIIGNSIEKVFVFAENLLNQINEKGVDFVRDRLIGLFEDIPGAGAFAPQIADRLIEQRQKTADFASLKDAFAEYDLTVIRDFQKLAEEIAGGRIEQLIQAGNPAEAERMMHDFYRLKELFLEQSVTLMERLYENFRDKAAYEKTWEDLADKWLVAGASGVVVLALLAYALIKAGMKVPGAVLNALRSAGSGSVQVGGRFAAVLGPVLAAVLGFWPTKMGDGTLQGEQDEPEK